MILTDNLKKFHTSHPSKNVYYDYALLHYTMRAQQQYT